MNTNSAYICIYYIYIYIFMFLTICFATQHNCNPTKRNFIDALPTKPRIHCAIRLREAQYTARPEKCWTMQSQHQSNDVLQTCFSVTTPAVTCPQDTHPTPSPFDSIVPHEIWRKAVMSNTNNIHIEINVKNNNS